jgi:hypothetical protein
LQIIEKNVYRIFSSIENSSESKEKPFKWLYR